MHVLYSTYREMAASRTMLLALLLLVLAATQLQVEGATPGVPQRCVELMPVLRRLEALLLKVTPANTSLAPPPAKTALSADALNKAGYQFMFQGHNYIALFNKFAWQQGYDTCLSLNMRMYEIQVPEKMDLFEPLYVENYLKFRHARIRGEEFWISCSRNLTELRMNGVASKFSPSYNLGEKSFKGDLLCTYIDNERFQLSMVDCKKNKLQVICE